MNADERRLKTKALSVLIGVHLWPLMFFSRPPTNSNSASLRPCVKKSRRGITLLELLIVMAIIALVAGVSFPSISAGIDGIRLTTASDSIATFFNAAVNRAERRQQVVEIAISRKENTLWLYSTEPGFVKKLEMPEGVSIQAVYPALEEEPQGPRRFIVLPGGAMPAIGVRIANFRGRARIVRVDPMTGFPRVENVEQR